MFDMTVKKKFLYVTALIIIAAVAIVLCVGYFNGGQDSEYDGTLVKLQSGSLEVL